MFKLYYEWIKLENTSETSWDLVSKIHIMSIINYFVFIRLFRKKKD